MGKRGPQKGAVYKPTKQKAEAREAARAVIERHFERILAAQIEASVGLSHLMLRQDDGTFKKAEGLTGEQIAAILNGNPNAFYISQSAPSVPAFNTLAGYYLDKPAEQEQTLNLNVTELGAALDRARLVAAQRNRTPGKGDGSA